MENIEAMLCAYIEGDLDEAGRAQIEKHLAENPQHRKLIDDLVATRDLVRGLPRVSAPSDVDESLRGQVERSILLDSGGDGQPRRGRAERWPQVLAMAAIFLLCASLGLILYRALWPTYKPPVAMEGFADRSGAVQTPQEAMKALTPSTRLTEPVDILAGKPAEAPLMAMGRKTLNDQGGVDVDGAALEKEIVVMPASFDAALVRRRLQASGYDVARPGAMGADAVLLVVNSANPAATNVQVAQFLNTTGGVSWTLVPSETDRETRSAGASNSNGGFPGPNTPMAGQPAFAYTTTQAGALDEKQNQNAMLEMVPLHGGAGESPATQPASDVYVASGLTAGEAETLRQTLVSPGNGTAVEAVVQSAAPLATTQPALAVAGPAAGNGTPFVTPVLTPPAATQESPEANAAAGATTAPSNASGVDSTFGVAAEAVKTVDAVIVVQSASSDQLPADVSGVAATQPAGRIQNEAAPLPWPTSQPSASSGNSTVDGGASPTGAGPASQPSAATQP